VDAINRNRPDAGQAEKLPFGRLVNVTKTFETVGQ